MSENQSALRSPWVLFWIGLLVVFVSANGVMIYLAIQRPGLVVDDYYERGQDYEKNMLKRMAKDPGWTMKVESPDYVDVAKPALFGFRISDKDGTPVTVDAVIFRAYRPADQRQDFEVPMVMVKPGFYQAEVTFPLLGVWDVLVSSIVGEDEYNTVHRLSAGVK